MGEEKEITITYETLFELLRREKTREELQRLSPTFFADVTRYLVEKQDMLQAQQEELFFGDEKNKTLLQIQNIRKILTELYDRREKKIFNLAIIRARTKGLVDMSALLDEEKRLCDALVQMLSGHRVSMLDQLLLGGMPKQRSMALPPRPQQQPAHASLAASSPSAQPVSRAVPVSPPEQKQDSMVTVRFTHPAPKFVGPRLEIYGPFEEGDVAALPELIATVLIEKGRAVTATQEQTREEESKVEAV